jgi:hypothetical protein
VVASLERNAFDPSKKRKLYLAMAAAQAAIALKERNCGLKNYS